MVVTRRAAIANLRSTKMLLWKWYFERNGIGFAELVHATERIALWPVQPAEGDTPTSGTS
jgi:hypothetical protein